MPRYDIKLIKKEIVAKNTMSFYFTKPAGFTYAAGQYADFTLINPPETDDEGDKRTFSFASAPFEPDLMITTRLRATAFKRTLKNLSEGSELELDGPYGSFVLPKDSSTPAVFLTGGIGCTFVRSMIAQAIQEGLAQKMVFFYSNNSPAEAVFLDEFLAFANQDKHFTFVPTMTQSQGEDWPGEQGIITIELVQKYVEDITAPVYYLSGPGAMVGDMRRMLAQAGVNKYNVRTDQFTGY